MVKVYKEELVLRTCHCDFQGTWRPSAILEAMQEAAGAHSELLGCGRNALMKKNTVWILYRSEVHMDVYPKIGERITIETFPTANRRWFMPRYYLFKNEADQVIGTAGSLWALLDINTRRMLSPAGVMEFMPDNSDLPLPMGLPATVSALDGEEKVMIRSPRYTDLDVNQHVNNTKYADWACDALGIDVMRAYCLDTLLVNYDTEIRPDQDIELHVSRQGLNFRVAGFHGDKMHFEVGGSLKPRDAILPMPL